MNFINHNKIQIYEKYKNLINSGKSKNNFDYYLFLNLFRK